MVPRKVDHGLRREEIVGALWRIAARRGLEAVTMREVAMEAGVSLGRVQYYFESKDDLVRRAAVALRARVDGVVRSRLEGVSGDSVRVLRAILLALLPLDEEGRAGALVGIAVFFRALRDPELVGDLRRGDEALMEVLGDRVRSAVVEGRLRPDLEVRLETRLLMAVVNGLGSDLLTGCVSSEEAVAAIDHQLSRLA
ncbi:TetR family transcriptional regulator C-terminal domain-containing protein [Nocardiopsis sp. NPDC006832]|uniref:TetR/AcrR family transcriptional regulator n=1 Tax=Nocardiopsis sp. NPDC006832 TaxID=3157188 RepID=UPI00340EAAAD